MYANHFSIDQKKTSDDMKDLFTYSQKVISENTSYSEIPKIKYTFQK